MITLNIKRLVFNIVLSSFVLSIFLKLLNISFWINIVFVSFLLFISFKKFLKKWKLLSSMIIPVYKSIPISFFIKSAFFFHSSSFISASFVFFINKFISLRNLVLFCLYVYFFILSNKAWGIFSWNKKYDIKSIMNISLI